MVFNKNRLISTTSLVSVFFILVFLSINAIASSFSYQINYDADNRVKSFILDDNLSTNYQYSANGSFKSITISGETYSEKFEVNGASNIDQQSNINLDNDLKISFSRKLKVSSCFSEIELLDYKKDSINTNITINNKILIINPTESLKINSTYLIKIPDCALQSVNNESLEETLEYTFSTGINAFGIAVTSIDAGDDHVINLREDGTVWTWGSNNEGQLGIDSTKNSGIPVQTLYLNNISKIYGFYRNSYAITNKKLSMSWGDNYNGMAGVYTSPQESRILLTPKQSQSNVKELFFNPFQTYFLSYTNSSDIYNLYMNDYNGNLKNMYRTVQNETNFDLNTPIKNISTDWNKNLYFLKKNGFVVGGICNFFFNCNYEYKNIPILTNIVNVHHWHKKRVHYALTSQGDIFSWNENLNYSIYDDKWRDLPKKMDDISNIKKISLSKSHVLTLKNDGTIWGWGSNSYGQLLSSLKNEQTTPTQLTFTNDGNFIDIAAGNNFSVALKDDGTVWTWGDNSKGQLGNNLKESKSSILNQALIGSFLDTNSSIETDEDGDSIIDSRDNCPSVINSDQKDSDNDQVGDSCDSDRDGDNVLNDQDAFPDNKDESVDSDNDGQGNNTDTDDDNDGISDQIEIEQGRNPIVNEAVVVTQIITTLLLSDENTVQAKSENNSEQETKNKQINDGCNKNLVEVENNKICEAEKVIKNTKNKSNLSKTNESYLLKKNVELKGEDKKTLSDLTIPKINLSVTQNNLKGSRVFKNLGNVIVEAKIDDMGNDIFSYNWFSDHLTNIGGSNLTTFVFDPTQIDVGQYNVNLNIDNGILTTNKTKQIKILEMGLSASNTLDTDHDGILDRDEQADKNENGILDYQEISYPDNEISLGKRKSAKADKNIKLKIGNIAFHQDNENILISETQLSQYLEEKSLPKYQKEIGVNTIEIFDYIANGVTDFNGNIKIIFPLSKSIEEYTYIRIYTSQRGWVDYTIDDSNYIETMISLDNTCNEYFDDRSQVWKSGLVINANCLRLTIQDGGLNDLDSQINGEIMNTIGILEKINVSN